MSSDPDYWNGPAWSLGFQAGMRVANETMIEPVKVEMTEPIFVLRGGAYLLDQHSGVLIDSAGNYSAKTRGNPRSLSLLLRAIADDIDDATDDLAGP